MNSNKHNIEKNDLDRVNELINNPDDDSENVLNFLKGDPNELIDSIVDLDDNSDTFNFIDIVDEKDETIKSKLKLNLNSPIESIESDHKTLNLNKSIKIEKTPDLFEGLKMQGENINFTVDLKDIQNETDSIVNLGVKDKKSSKFKSKLNNKKDKASKKAEKVKKKSKPKKDKKVKKQKLFAKNKDKAIVDENTNKVIDKTEDSIEGVSILIEERYKAMKKKKIITTAGIIILSIFLIIFGTYNTFLKKEKSPNQIAAEVNAINRTTPFPTDGIEGFIKQNINNMIKDNVVMLQGTLEAEISPLDLYITSISKRSAYIANVYFTAKIKTNQGENYHNFFVAIGYDYENFSYSPASDIQITPNEPKDNIVIVDNDVLSFKDIKAIPEIEKNKARTFVENFLMMVYNEEVDVSPYYKGTDELGDPNAKFIQVENFEYYEDYNKNLYNAKVTYILSLNEGLEFRVTNYLDIISSGPDLYTINAIL